MPLSFEEKMLMHKAIEHADSYGDCNVYPCRDRHGKDLSWDKCFIDQPTPDGSTELELWFNHETSYGVTTGMVR